ncbi:MAG: MATE family efflux transporter [Oscillospiraceae bacterium]|nr:MATE family efflux transporter [Oscillospiraceae bacterium]
MITDLTKGKPSSLIWRFTLPMLISIAFQQMYNICDSIIAGNFVGSTPIEGELALAAVGASYPVTMLFIQIANGINGGCAVVISQLFGAKEFVRMKTAVSTSLIATLTLAVILTIAGLIFCEPIMNLLNTQADIFADSVLYLRIYIGGLVFLFLYNVCTGIFTALGDSKTPLIFLIISSVANIVLDLIMVIPLDMGVAGVAWATFIAQGASAVLAAITLFARLRKIQTPHRSPLFSPNMLKTISRIAIPTICQQSFVSVGNLFIQSLVNDMGAAVIAGYSSAIKLNTFAVNAMACVSNGISSYTAQNIGAGKHERIPQGFKAGMVFTAICVVPFLVCYIGFSDFMIELFFSEPSEEALNIGTSFLRAAAPFYIVLGVKLLADGVLKGAGAMRSFMAATFSDLLLRVALSYILVPKMGFDGFLWAWPIGWSLAAVMSFCFYFKGNWKETAFSGALNK